MEKKDKMENSEDRIFRIFEEFEESLIEESKKASGEDTRGVPVFRSTGAKSGTVEFRRNIKRARTN